MLCAFKKIVLDEHGENFLSHFFSLIDSRGFVIPDSSQTQGVNASTGKESNAVNVKHEYYGSTNNTKVWPSTNPHLHT